MKKCKGCGATLQCEDKTLPGYALNESQEYCQRCFRLIHYGDAQRLNKEKVSNEDVFKLYEEYKDEVFVLVVEAFDALVLNLDYLLNIYKNKKLILVINKIDLLPLNVKDEKVDKLFMSAISKSKRDNILNCLITYNKDPYFKELFLATLKEFKLKKAVFAGRVNAGKSSIINKLLEDNSLTVSTYPGTTIAANIIENDEYTFIDTPGLNDSESFVDNIDKNDIKKLIPLKTIKNKIYQCYEDQSYSIQGLIDINIKTKKLITISFYINNDLEVHRTKLSNSVKFLNAHKDEFKLSLMPFNDNNYKVNEKKMFYIKGLGFIKISGRCDINIKINEKIKIYTCEVDL